MPDRVIVTSAEFVRNIGAWQAQALSAPVSISHHGRERLVLLSAERYGALMTATAQAPSDIDRAASFVLDHIADGYIALSRDMSILALNYAAENFLGVARRQVEGANLTALFPALAGSVFLTQLQRVVQRREPISFEADLASFGGAPLVFNAFPLADGVGVLFSNIAERAELQALAADAGAVGSAIAAHPNISLLKCDSRGRFVEIDEKFAAWMAFDPVGLINWRLFDIVAAGDRRRVSDCFEASITTSAPAHTQARLLAKNLDERPMWLSFAAAPANDRDRGVRVACAPAPKG
ncbi:MAG: PAS domain-containing protein [Hyphomonadaceae bacterium]|nr:PAS domain-containing protein [Hyphomonadaceae bacterium]